jgi:hypothetical protein
MPDLHELLEGAVEAPTFFDLADVGRRVDRGYRRRRIATVGAAVAALAAVVAISAALHDGNRVDTEPVPPVTEPDGATTTPAPRECTADDLSVHPTSSRVGAFGEAHLYAMVGPSDGEDRGCTVDATATVTLRGIDSDEVLPVEGNPITVPLAGETALDARGISFPRDVVWSGCMPGQAAGDPGRVTIEVEIEGIGTYRGTGDGPQCDDPDAGSTVRMVDPLNPPTDLPECIADDLDVAPTGDGATAQMAIYAAITPVDGHVCRMTGVEVTTTLRDIATGDVLDVEGNPNVQHVSGALGAGQSGLDLETLVWSGCLPGVGGEEAVDVTVEVVIDGVGTYEGTSISPRCEVPGSGSSIG